MVELTKQVAGKLERKTAVDEKFVYRLARCSSAHLNPLAAFAGGVLGQEVDLLLMRGYRPPCAAVLMLAPCCCQVLKACSGKFTPLSQVH